MIRYFVEYSSTTATAVSLPVIPHIIYKQHSNNTQELCTFRTIRAIYRNSRV